MSVVISPSPSRNTVHSFPPPQAQNPISLRLYKVLGASFDDDATKEALYTLSELYAPDATVSTSAKGKEVKRNLEEDDWAEGSVSKTQEKEKDQNGVLPREPVPGDLAARARRNLRRDVENKLAESSRSFLKAFGEVDKVCNFIVFPWIADVYIMREIFAATRYTAGASRGHAAAMRRGADTAPRDERVVQIIARSRREPQGRTVCIICVLFLLRTPELWDIDRRCQRDSQ